MQIWAGLGNPGAQYALHRHNVGFMAVDLIAEVYGFSPWTKKFRSLVAEGKIGRHRILLLKPQTFMNLSGHAVSCLVAKIDSESPVNSLVVISDDLALPLGRIRIRERGTAGGHNGLKSIIASLGTTEFVRLRIGIQPDHPISDPKRFVLDSFARSERTVVIETIEKSANAIRAIIRDGALKAMAEFN